MASNSSVSFLKNTILGGILFLGPLVLLYIIIDKAIVIFRQITDPIASYLTIDWIYGIQLSRILAFLAIVAICFLFGLFSNSKRAIQMREWIEDHILSIFPGYTFVKSMGESMSGLTTDNLKTVVLVDIEEVWQIGFKMEKIEDDLHVVYIPGAPNPLAGDVMIVRSDRMREIEISSMDAMRFSSRLGQKSKIKLQGKINSSTFPKRN